MPKISSSSAGDGKKKKKSVTTPTTTAEFRKQIETKITPQESDRVQKIESFTDKPPKKTEALKYGDSMIDLPEGAHIPGTFKISSPEWAEDKKVSATDYYNYIFTGIEEARATRGERPLTPAEKQDYIIKSLSNQFNTKGNAGADTEIFKNRQAELGIENVPTPQNLPEGVSPNQAANANLSSQVGNTNPENLSPEGLKVAAALGTGASYAVPGVASGLIGGATIGALGGPVGAVGGALLGGVGAFVTGFISNLRSQAGSKITSANSSATEIEKNLRAIITDTNSNPANASQNLDLFNYQLARLDKAHDMLVLETRSNTFKFLGKNGIAELEKFEIFDSVGGGRETLIRLMQEAVNIPDPTKVLLSMDEIE